jgi:hypothetical protein
MLFFTSTSGVGMTSKRNIVSETQKFVFDIAIHIEGAPLHK